MDDTSALGPTEVPVSDITDTEGAGGSREPDPAFSFGMAPVVRTWPPDSMFGTAESVNTSLVILRILKYIRSHIT